MKTLLSEPVPIGSACFVPSGQYLLTASHDHCIRLWHCFANQWDRVYVGHRNECICTSIDTTVLDNKIPIIGCGSEVCSIVFLCVVMGV